MKKLLIGLALASCSQVAMAQNNEQFSGLTIKPIEELKLSQNEVTVNGKKYQTYGSSSVTEGLEVFSNQGSSVYVVTGEIIVKLNKDVDFNQFNADNDLIIKQAYKSYYILKSESKRDLQPLVDALKVLDGVSSVTLELAEKGIIEK